MNIDYYGKVLWNYHNLNQKIKKCDLILGFGSHDLNVAKRCAELFLDGYGDIIIFTGGFGRITKELWNMTEAEKFAQIAINMGVPKDKIIIASVCNDIYLYNLQNKVWMKIAESDYYSDEQLLDFALELLNITKTDLINILKARK